MLRLRTLCVGVVVVTLLAVRARAQVQPVDDAGVSVTAVQALEAHTGAEPDGNDDPEDPGTGTLPSALRLQRVGRAPKALRRICDLTPMAGALFAAHANSPLGSDGATITRYDPTAQSPFSLAFDWNRPGQPARGGGGGQGFLRVRAIGGRLFVPDADPPYAGFGLADRGTEGYVFVSDTRGVFAAPGGPRLRPPSPPQVTGAPGAAVLPRAYHVIDVGRFRGRYYASTGSVPPGERAWVGASPGALHAADTSLARWTYEVDHPYPWREGVWRLGYMVRFRGKLFIGIQDYDGREPNDYVWVLPPAGAPTVTRVDMHPTRVTTQGGALTLRWYTDRGRLYWLAYERNNTVSLRVTEDGDRWFPVALPPDAGVPTDVTRFRDAVVVLTSRGLWRIDTVVPVRLASVPLDVRGNGPFDVNDLFCAAPLAVFQNALYAGGQRDGALYRFIE
jgi:hypothetical protein